MPTIETAVERLAGQLPLHRRQQDLVPGLARAHRAILRSFAEIGRPPTDGELQHVAGVDAAAVITGLAAEDLIVASRGRISGAYPFTLEPTPHALTIGEVRVNAMCSLDAVAVAPVFGLEVVTDSTCEVTGAPIRIHQVAGTVESAAPPLLRIGVRWQQPDGCAAHSMCRDMVFLSDVETAERWRGPDPDAAGIFDLAEAVAFGVGFFGPLLED